MAASGLVAFIRENWADLISFYDHQNSEFKPLAVEAITKLRHLCSADGGVFFITHLDGQESNKRLIQDAKRELSRWIAGVVPRAHKPIEQ
jgi:hypothetical protein